VKADPSIGPNGRLLFHEHTDPSLFGKRCGAVWGEMAPPGDKPGTMHWCSREMVEVRDPDGLATATANPASHPGKHRCTCGEYHGFDPAPVVVCRFPAGKPDGPECGAAVIGMRRETHVREGSLMRGLPKQKFLIIRSKPCDHVVRRGF
jgi:hypothetical protein